MRNRQLWFGIGVLLMALCAGYAVKLDSPPLPPEALLAVVLLGGLAIVAEMLAFLLPHGARGSIAFIPYLASVLIAPHWTAVLAIAVVATLVHLSLRARLESFIFNIAQHTLNLAIAILVYRQLGGESFLTVPNAGLARLTGSMGLPALSAYAVSFFVNTLVATTFIALGEGGSPLAVWRDVKLSTIGVDLLASPIVFVFAWVYARFGPIAAALVWVPIVGLRQVHKTNLELEQTNEELLELMIKSIEARDPYTSGHSRRVRHYSIQIARAMGIRESEIDLIGRAALLHDVGKIHEKYGPILVKADRLTPEEWATMQEHPADGAALVATMSRLRELVAPVRHHHENWDGTGYPDRLAGEAIPIAARIIRFADTIDAMTTHRLYRSALSPEQVRAEIMRCRGTQFDPFLADRLLSSPIWGSMLTPQPAVPVQTKGLSLLRPQRRSGSSR